MVQLLGAGQVSGIGRGCTVKEALSNNGLVWRKRTARTEPYATNLGTKCFTGSCFGLNGALGRRILCGEKVRSPPKAPAL